jgi:hypothetical protein
MKKKEEGEKEKVSLDEFKEVLKIFKSMLNEGDIKIDFAPYGQCGVTIEGDRLDKELTSSKVDKETFDSGEDECIPLLNRILGDKEKSFLQRIPEDEREEIENKCEMIEKGLITEGLVEKFLFQTTCKNYLLEDFDWEMIEHRGKEEEESLSTVMMQFKLRNPSKEFPRPTLPIGAGRESVSFECRKGNIEELIEELEKIKKRFEKWED